MKMAMRCPRCHSEAVKWKHEDRFVCGCGWASSPSEKDIDTPVHVRHTTPVVDSKLNRRNT